MLPAAPSEVPNRAVSWLDEHVFVVELDDCVDDDAEDDDDVVDDDDADVVVSDVEGLAVVESEVVGLDALGDADDPPHPAVPSASMVTAIAAITGMMPCVRRRSGPR